jgi:hypothetical protein
MLRSSRYTREEVRAALSAMKEAGVLSYARGVYQATSTTGGAAPREELSGKGGDSAPRQL